MRMAISLYLGMCEQDLEHEWQVERTSSTRALEKYGPQAITTRLASWFDHVGAGMWRFFTFYCFMVQKALGVIDPPSMPLARDRGLHASIMQKYWGTMKDHVSGLTAPVGDDKVLGHVSDSAMDGIMEWVLLQISSCRYHIHGQRQASRHVFRYQDKPASCVRSERNPTAS